MVANRNQRMDWDDPQVITELKEQWAQGKSAGNIAANFRASGMPWCTRNMIIGKVARLGLAGRRVAIRVNTKRRERRASTHRKFINRVAAIEINMNLGAPEPLCIPIYDLEMHHCRMVVDGKCDRGQALYCGHDVLILDTSRSWCAYHARMVYRPAGRAA